MDVSALGEFGLIASLASKIARPAKDLVLGIGDDAAIWRSTPGYTVATTDILIEDVHFTLATCPWFALGWKALAVNLSDVAAMGGTPRYALVSIGLPPSTKAAAVDDLYSGMMALADRFGVSIVGGDTVRSPKLVVVSPTVIGDVTAVGGVIRLLRRDRARPGDLIGITGTLGASAAGLDLLLHPRDVAPDILAVLRSSHLTPMPRLQEAQVLLAAGVEAAMDISDGLVGDLQKLCLASGASAIVELPLVPTGVPLRSVFGSRALDLALYGGEDYELLFTAPPNVFQEAQRRLAEAALAPAARIGEVVHGTPGQVQLRDAAGKLEVAQRGGYDAFGGV